MSTPLLKSAMRAGPLLPIAARFFVAVAGLLLLPASLRADPATYKATAGTVAFTVGANIPYLKVSGSSTELHGGGQATVAGNTATIRSLRFELDPKTFKTGIKLRDKHLYEKVFAASDGSVPALVLQAPVFTATLDSKTSKWQGQLRAQVTMRGVTKPVAFSATIDKKGAGAVVNANGTIKTSDFGVKTISYAGATVNDDVQVSINGLSVEP
jgi:polyisoprenoid-binding protein YceI